MSEQALILVLSVSLNMLIGFVVGYWLSTAQVRKRESSNSIKPTMLARERRMSHILSGKRYQLRRSIDIGCGIDNPPDESGVK